MQGVYLRSDELVEVWGDVESNAIYGAGQGDPAEEQDEQHEVGVGGGEIHHLRAIGVMKSHRFPFCESHTNNTCDLL